MSRLKAHWLAVICNHREAGSKFGLCRVIPRVGLYRTLTASLAAQLRVQSLDEEISNRSSRGGSVVQGNTDVRTSTDINGTRAPNGPPPSGEIRAARIRTSSAI